MRCRIAIRSLRDLSLGFLLLALGPHPSASAQDKTPQSAAHRASPAPTDRFLGVWKLNLDKSSPTAAASELIAIESQGSADKFTYNWVGLSGTTLQFWFVTDMKGGIVKQTLASGEPMTSESRITRLDASRFTDVSSILRDRYEVSADGRTMTIRRTYLLNDEPHKAPTEKTLVFDRQK